MAMDAGTAPADQHLVDPLLDLHRRRSTKAHFLLSTSAGNEMVGIRQIWTGLKKLLVSMPGSMKVEDLAEMVLMLAMLILLVTLVAKPTMPREASMS